MKHERILTQMNIPSYPMLLYLIANFSSANVMYNHIDSFYDKPIIEAHKFTFVHQTFRPTYFHHKVSSK